MNKNRKESSLHRALKIEYAKLEERTEQIIGNYICDGVTDSGELIEVQTGSFGPLREKIQTLTEKYPLRIIHPVIIQKTIELHSQDGTLLHRRKSPKKGTPWDLFNYLLNAPLLPLTEGLTIELVMVDIIELRTMDGKGSWRRKGISIQDKILEHYYYAILLKGLNDYYQFVPCILTGEFTVKDLSAQAGISVSLAQKTLYVLSRLNIVEKIRKIKAAWSYSLKKG